jgi:hypothetical protein
MKRNLWKLCFIGCLTACDSKPSEKSIFSAKGLPPVEVAQKYEERIAALQKQIAAQQKEIQKLKVGQTKRPTTKPDLVPSGSSGFLAGPVEVDGLYMLMDIPKGETLNQDQFAHLLKGETPFNPGAIPSSGIAVTDATPLALGQDLQMKWGSTWWAATVTGFESDGGIRVHYFGWDEAHDEIVPRSDLQLDTNVREKAIRTVYQVPE